MGTGGRPDRGVCAAADVQYLSTGSARAAAVLATDAAFAHVQAERTVLVPRVAPYRPGEFYLPPHQGPSGLGRRHRWRSPGAMTDLGGRSAHPRAGRPAQQTVDLPPGYPQEYRRLVTLRDGRSVLIRPIKPSDAPALAEAIQSADADTIHRRYLGGRPRVTPELLEHLTTVDYTSRFALLAVEPASQRGVAIARYEPAEQDGTADVAIAVTPGWRDVGLAGEQLRMLAQAASERGIHTFTGTYLADNSPVAALIHEADERANRVTSHGIAEFSVPLRPPDPGP